MTKIFITAGMLACSNIFMTFAWYGHLKNLNSKPWIVAALISWGIALFEYLIQVPANRIGHQAMNLGQLKILQEVITLLVFVPFSIFYMKEGIKQEYIWASVFILAAVFCIFRGAFVK
ncbi:MAG: DMT family protein [Candidatus Omnitrophota bacterium]